VFPIALSWQRGGGISSGPMRHVLVIPPTTRSRILAEKLTVAHRINSSTSKEHDGSLPCEQLKETELYLPQYDQDPF
jgi:hypothetical protein